MGNNMMVSNETGEFARVLGTQLAAVAAGATVLLSFTFLPNDVNNSGAQAIWRSNSITSAQNKSNIADEAIGKALKRIGLFANLKAGWDGEDGIPISSKAIQTAENLITQLRCVPEVFPLSDGGIQLEWEYGDNYLEIEIHDSSILHLYYELADGNNSELDIDISQLSNIKLIANVLERMGGN